MGISAYVPLYDLEYILVDDIRLEYPVWLLRCRSSLAVFVKTWQDE